MHAAILSNPSPPRGLPWQCQRHAVMYIRRCCRPSQGTHLCLHCAEGLECIHKAEGCSVVGVEVCGHTRTEHPCRRQAGQGSTAGARQSSISMQSWEVGGHTRAEHPCWRQGRGQGARGSGDEGRAARGCSVGFAEKGRGQAMCMWLQPGRAAGSSAGPACLAATPPGLRAPLPAGRHPGSRKLARRRAAGGQVGAGKDAGAGR